MNFLLLSLRIKSLLNCCYSIAVRKIHRVNGIVIQSGKCSETTYSNYEPKNKRSRRSFQLPRQLNGEVSYKKTIGPEQLHCPDSFLCLEFKRNMLIMDFISKRKYKLCCSNWTSFNVLKRNEMPILSGNMQYLTSIKPPTREMNTIVTVLDCCLKIKEQLRLNYILCVFDQSTYYKAIELEWRYPDKYKGYTVMLDIFHMIMMFLGIIGNKIFRWRFKRPCCTKWCGSYWIS